MENLGKQKRGLTTRRVRASDGLSSWKDTREQRAEFILRTSIGVENRRCTSFWRHNWIESKLKDTFPTLFRLSSHNGPL